MDRSRPVEARSTGANLTSMPQKIKWTRRCSTRGGKCTVTWVFRKGASNFVHRGVQVIRAPLRHDRKVAKYITYKRVVFQALHLAEPQKRNIKSLPPQYCPYTIGGFNSTHTLKCPPRKIVTGSLTLISTKKSSLRKYNIILGRSRLLDHTLERY